MPPLTSLTPTLTSLTPKMPEVPPCPVFTSQTAVHTHSCACLSCGCGCSVNPTGSQLPATSDRPCLSLKILLIHFSMRSHSASPPHPFVQFLFRAAETATNCRFSAITLRGGPGPNLPNPTCAQFCSSPAPRHQLPVTSSPSPAPRHQLPRHQSRTSSPTRLPLDTCLWRGR